MAPSKSQSQRTKSRRDRSPSSDADAAAANGTVAAQLAAEIEALELTHPLKTCRHLFLQVLMARKSMDVETAKVMYDECVRLCKVENPDPFATFLGELEPKLSLCGLDIKTTRNQETGKGLYVLVNTIQDDPAKLATEYKPEEIALFKAIVEKIMLAPRFAYSVTQQEAIKCAKSPMTRTAASQVMKSFLAKGWLTLHTSGRLVLSARTLVELSTYLRDTYNDDAADEDDPAGRTVVDCSFCLSIVTNGYKCPNEDCGIRLHTFCIAQQIQDGRCPDRLELGKENPCEQIWPRNPNTRKYHGTPVGVLALSSQGGADDESDPESEMDVEETQGSRQQKRARKSGASGGKGKGKGRKSRAEDSEEDEDELMDEDEDEDSNAGTSPAAVRKSSGRAAAAKAKKRVVLASDEEDDDEE